MNRFTAPHIPPRGMAQQPQTAHEWLSARAAGARAADTFERHAANARLVDAFVRNRPGVLGIWTKELYRKWPVVDAFAAEVHPRWESLKEQGNEALHHGSIDQAIELYSDALTVADASEGVDAFFDAMDDHAEGSAGHRLAAARTDIEQLIVQAMPGPGRHDPNRPAAICLANRASALIKAGCASEAVLDARAAIETCAEYLKGHHRLKQALLAANSTEEARQVGEQIRRFETLQSAGDAMYIGFLLHCVGWLSANDYDDVYEGPRCYHWLRHAMDLCLFNGLSSVSGLRVHMEVFDVELQQRDAHWVSLSLSVAAPRPEDPEDPEEGEELSTAQYSMAEELSMLPSIDYKYLHLGRLDTQGLLDFSRLCLRGSHAPLAHRLAEAAFLATLLKHQLDYLPFLTSLSLGPPLSMYVDEVRQGLDADGLLIPRAHTSYFLLPTSYRYDGASMRTASSYRACLDVSSTASMYATRRGGASTIAASATAV